MTVDEGIALVGIVIGVLGFFAAKSVIKKRKSQRQSVDAGSIGIQSGRDTKIGQ